MNWLERGEAKGMLHQPFAPPALIFCGLCLPLILGLIPPNRLYGVRTPKTLGDPRVWYAANRRAGILLILSSLFYLGVARFYPYGGPDDFGTWLLHLGAFLGSIVASLMATGAYVKEL
jgi:hypothetical protein